MNLCQSAQNSWRSWLTLAPDSWNKRGPRSVDLPSASVPASRRADSGKRDENPVRRTGVPKYDSVPGCLLRFNLSECFGNRTS
jgi:hypothetical protein